MKTKSGVKHYILLALFVASVFTTTLSLFMPVSAKSFSAMTPTEQAKSWLYFNALGACMDTEENTNFLADDKNYFDPDSRLRESNVNSGSWFANPLVGAVNPTIGYFLAGKGLSVGGDRVGCGGDNTDWIKDAVTLWGYSNPVDALCSFGFKRENNSDCRDGNDWFVRGDASLSKFEKSVKDKAYGGSTPALPPAAHYILARDTFFTGCIGDTTPSPYTGNANDDFTYTINLVGDNNTPTPTKYYGDKKKSDEIWYSISPNHNNITRKCSELAADINQYAQAYAALAVSDPEIIQADTEQSTATTTGNTPGATSTCQVEGIGWIVCPIMTFMAKIVDAAYGFVSSLLVVQPLMTTGGTAGVYTAWTVMRNFANVAFVIVFLIIIFSQLTSVGVSNYGIKKMLPRLIVAAILVNISYWVCAIAVDLSNIVGGSIVGLFESNQLQAALSVPDPAQLSSAATGSGWTGITGGILAGVVAGGIALYVGLSALVPALLAALLAIVTVFLVLTLRQALIILLVVISPLAFVAYLLPNTESLFGKWRGLLQTLLFMYPIISFIFGASALASSIVMDSASGSYKIVIQIMGALIAILPLAITPVVMKSAGGLLNRFAGVVNNPNKGPFDRMRKKAEGYRGYRQNSRRANALSGGKVFGGGQFKRATRRTLRDNATEAAAKSGEAQFGVTDSKARGYVNQTTQSQAQVSAINAANNARFVNGVANNSMSVGGGMNSKATDDPFVAQALAAQQEKAVAEAIKDARLSANIAPGDITKIGEEMASAIQSGDSIKARAMQDMLLSSGSKGISQYRDTMTALEGETTPDGGKLMDSEAVTAMRKNILDNHGNVKSAANDIVQHAVSGGAMSAASANPATWNLPDVELVNQKTASVHLAIDSGAVSKEQAMRISSNEELAKHLDQGVRDRIEDIATRP